MMIIKKYVKILINLILIVQLKIVYSNFNFNFLYFIHLFFLYLNKYRKKNAIALKIYNNEMKLYKTINNSFHTF